MFFKFYCDFDGNWLMWNKYRGVGNINKVEELWGNFYLINIIRGRED